MYPKVNQNIVINIRRHEQSFRSIIAEVGDKEILIAFPMDLKIMGLLSDGTKLAVSFISGENKYKFQTEIIGKIKDNIALYRITKPQEKEIIRVQQRDNFRVNSNLRLILKENELTTIDISAGGMLISCNMDIKLEEREVVSGTLFVPTSQKQELNPIPFQGQIIRINQLKDQERKKVAIKFIKIDKRDQTKIIQHCFDKQRQIRLKTR